VIEVVENELKGGRHSPRCNAIDPLASVTWRTPQRSSTNATDLDRLVEEGERAFGFLDGEIAAQEGEADREREKMPASRPTRTDHPRSAPIRRVRAGARFASTGCHGELVVVSDARGELGPLVSVLPDLLVITPEERENCPAFATVTSRTPNAC